MEADRADKSAQFSQLSTFSETLLDRFSSNHGS